MEIAQIKQAVKNEPFRPFTMRLVDGREYHVPHPEFLYVPPNMRHTVVVTASGSDAMTILDSVMVASIVYTENGDRRQ